MQCYQSIDSLSVEEIALKTTGVASTDFWMWWLMQCNLRHIYSAVDPNEFK